MTYLATEISDEELASLTNAIKARYGIDFTNYERKSLKRGFARLIVKRKLDSLLALWGKIISDREFFLGCVDDLTVNLTELFRNPEIWVQIRDEILPKFATNFRVNMWHAGCSSGEEVYTMAVVLKEANMIRKTKAIATDLSEGMIQKAIEGKYSSVVMNKYKESLKEFAPHYTVDQVFDVEDYSAIVKPEFKSHVNFYKHNLVQDPMDQMFDVIFCRNVMIYFDDQLKMKVLKMFHEHLNPNGFFIVGYYDMLPDGAKTLFKVYDNKTRIYQKI